MTPSQAAKIIGCTPRHVRWLVRNGKLAAAVRQYPGGYYYEIEETEAARYRDTRHKGGFPRGEHRKKGTSYVPNPIESR